MRLLLVLAILLLPLLNIPRVFAPLRTTTKVDKCTVSPCVSAALAVSASDLIMVHTSCFSTGNAVGTPTDTIGNTFTQDLAEQSGSSGFYAVYHAFSSFGASDSVSVTFNTCTNSGDSVLSFSVEVYNGIAAVRSTNGKIVSLTPASGACANCVDTISLNVLPTSIVYEAFDVFSQNGGCPLITPTTQTNRQTFTCNQPTNPNVKQAGVSEDTQTGSQGGPTSFTNSWTDSGSFLGNADLVSHMVIELTVSNTILQAVTQCYGNCGSPAITLVNTNSTHTINFNQTITVLYEFQSNLNGFIINVTTNVARSYTTGQGVNIFLYTVYSCPSDQTPFSTACPGQLLTYGTSGGNVQKGRFSLPAGSRYTVSNGQWIAIALSGTYSGLDLNDTNTNVALFSTNNGKIPATITNPSATTITKMGLWAWIIGNVIVGVPPSTQTGAGGQFCGFFDCLFGALINSFCSNLTVGCQTSSGIFWAIIFTIITVMSLKFGEVKLFGSQSSKMAFGGEIFGMIFLGFVFLEAGLGLITAFVPIFFIMVISVIFGKHTGRFF